MASILYERRLATRTPTKTRHHSITFTLSENSFRNNKASFRS